MAEQQPYLSNAACNPLVSRESMIYRLMYVPHAPCQLIRHGECAR